MKNILLLLITLNLGLVACNHQCPQEQPQIIRPDKAPNNATIDDSTTIKTVVISDNSEHKILSKTEFSKYLYQKRNLCSVDPKMSMFSWKNAYVNPLAEKDYNGYQAGVIINLLLFDDFTYLLRVWDANIDMFGFASYSTWTNNESRPEISGEWTANYNNSIQLDIDIRGELFKFNDEDTLDLQFGENIPKEISDLAGSTVWLVFSIVPPVFNEDLSCPLE